VLTLAQSDLEATPYYHCVSRCVRRAFLCGHDRFTGRRIDHRKGWIVGKLTALTDVFAVQEVRLEDRSTGSGAHLRDLRRCADWYQIYSGVTAASPYSCLI
jgi:hypothetical protein